MAPVILIATGWDRYWGTDAYFRHPVLTGEAASALVDAGMHVLGLDTPSPDALDDDALTTHEGILGADRLIIENLRGLTDLPRVVDFTAFPLNIAGGDGAPVRAVARRPVTWAVGEYAYPGPLRDALVAAILNGDKTSTTSLVEEYEATGEQLPLPGDKEVVVTSDGTPACVIEITAVRVCRLDEVTEQHARDEGEGYETVVEWRRGHEQFWTSPEFRAEQPGFVVEDATEVVCAQFEFLAPLDMEDSEDD